MISLMLKWANELKWANLQSKQAKKKENKLAEESLQGFETD